MAPPRLKWMSACGLPVRVPTPVVAAPRPPYGTARTATTVGSPVRHIRTVRLRFGERLQPVHVVRGSARTSTPLRSRLLPSALSPANAVGADRIGSSSALIPPQMPMRVRSYGRSIPSGRRGGSGSRTRSVARNYGSTNSNAPRAAGRRRSRTRLRRSATAA